MCLLAGSKTSSCVQVALCCSVPAHWPLLKTRLEKICPRSQGAQALWRWNSRGQEPLQHPFLLQVTSYNREGVLHDLMHVLWEADVAVFKAHITTGPSEKVLDLFWIYDNKKELPENHRILQICDLVKDCVGQQDAKCSISPAPAGSCADDSTSALLKRCACKDAKPAASLRKITSHRKSSNSVQSDLSSWQGSQSEEYGHGREEVQVAIDNSTTSAYSLINIVCKDRKGLVYDLMRTVKDIHIRVAYGKVLVRQDYMCEADLFVQEVDGSQITEQEAQDELIERVKQAAALPVVISIQDVYDETCTELLVLANLDSGARGRPRVTYDVTAALNAMQLCVFMADVYIESPGGAGEQRPQELHRFLVHCIDGCRLRSAAEKRSMYECVHASLTGTELVSTPFPAQLSDCAKRTEQEAARHATGGKLFQRWKW
ncbi:hypothetical protein ABBQ32_012162 [Trebouxia sp. C0010 RCD-2024]